MCLVPFGKAPDSTVSIPGNRAAQKENVIEMKFGQLLKTTRKRLSPWVTLVEKIVQQPSGKAVYHSLDLADYLTILALTPERKALFIRQYRPALDALTLELPGGLAEENEEYETGIGRELVEETGFEPTGPILSLGQHYTDVGRLENRCHVFFTEEVRRNPDAEVEEGIECLELSPEEVVKAIRSGQFNYLHHQAILFLAVSQGLWPELVMALNLSSQVDRHP